MHGGLLSCPITRNQESHDGALLFLQLFFHSSCAFPRRDAAVSACDDDL